MDSTPGGSINGGGGNNGGHGYTFNGADIINLILGAVIFFIVTAWYQATEDYFDHLRGIQNEYLVSLYFAIIWTLISIIILAVGYLYYKYLYPNGTSSANNLQVPTRGISG